MVYVSDRLGVYRIQHQGMDYFFVVVGSTREFTWLGQVEFMGQIHVGILAKE